jgi:hypothetical protein
MTAKTRIVLATGAAAVVVAGYLLGPWRPSAGRSATVELRRAQHLEDELRRTRERYRDQEAVAQEVVAGRLTLLQAAARVCAIRADEPPLVRDLARRRHPGLSEKEWFSAVVIDFVRRILAEDPDRQAAIVGRLEAELQRQLGPGRRLPAPAQAEAVAQGGQPADQGQPPRADRPGPARRPAAAPLPLPIAAQGGAAPVRVGPLLPAAREVVPMVRTAKFSAE